MLVIPKPTRYILNSFTGHNCKFFWHFNILQRNPSDYERAFLFYVLSMSHHLSIFNNIPKNSKNIYSTKTVSMSNLTI